MLATNDTALAERLRILRSHGMTSLSWDRHQGHASTYDVVDLGYNYRIDEVRSALGRAQLKKVFYNNKRREQLTILYKKLLAELVPEVQVPFQEARGTSCYHIMPVLLPAGVDRYKFMENMKAQGIQTSNHYPPVHQFYIYQQAELQNRHPLVFTEEAAGREVTLPLYPTMQDEQAEWVVRATQQALQAMC